MMDAPNTNTNRRAGARLASLSHHLCAVEISAKHIHLSPQDLETLFGKGYELTPIAFLASLPEEIAVQAGFAAKETVTIIGSKAGRALNNVRVLGPPRGATQLELAYTDALQVGIKAPVRISGNTAGSAPFIVVGPKGVIECKEGAIRAWRHIHIPLTIANWMGVKDGDMMAVRVKSPMCSVVLEDVMVRSMPFPEEMMKIIDGHNIKLGAELHLDTDEGNACMLKAATSYELLKKGPDGSFITVFEKKL